MTNEWPDRLLYRCQHDTKRPTVRPDHSSHPVIGQGKLHASFWLMIGRNRPSILLKSMYCAKYILADDLKARLRTVLSRPKWLRGSRCVVAPWVTAIARGADVRNECIDWMSDVCRDIIKIFNLYVFDVKTRYRRFDRLDLSLSSTMTSDSENNKIIYLLMRCVSKLDYYMIKLSHFKSNQKYNHLQKSSQLRLLR
jgi:hypothetical protein